MMRNSYNQNTIELSENQAIVDKKLTQCYHDCQQNSFYGFITTIFIISFSSGGWYVSTTFTKCSGL